MSKINHKIADALTQDGFEIRTIDSKIVADKSQTKIVVNRHNEIQTRVNYIHVLNQMPNRVNQVSGVPFSEIKKLLKYERKATKSLSETFVKVSEKYNWDNMLFSDYDLDSHTDIKYAEIFADGDSYTFVFIKDEFHESFIAFNLSSRELIQKLNKLEIHHQELNLIAPSLYKVISATE